MMFEIWNRASGNALGEFETVEAALDAIRQELAVHGRTYVTDWLLAVADDEDAQPIAAGDALIALAETAIRV